MTFEEIDNLANLQGVSANLMVGELLQVVFLDALYRDKASDAIHFQGGTSIRLLHNGWRYSEDLDFATLIESSSELEGIVEKSYKQAVRMLDLLFGPNSFMLTLKKKPARGKLHTYWLNFTHPAAARLFKVKLEFAGFPVHRPRPFPVTRHDLVFAITPLVMSQDTTELLADKITAFAGRPYVKGRDLFDLWYLTKTLQVTVDSPLVERKFQDYGLSKPVESLKRNLALMNPERIAQEMDRFLPEPYRSRLAKDGYKSVYEAAASVVHLFVGGA